VRWRPSIDYCLSGAMQYSLLESEESNLGPRRDILRGLLRALPVFSVVAFVGILAQRSTVHTSISGAVQLFGCATIAEPPLKGQSYSVWDSIPETYNTNGIVANWDVSRGNYSWTAPLITGGAEHGRAWWIHGPEYQVDTASGTWTSRAFVGTQALERNHTSCCCQYMIAKGDLFWLTEYCRAVVPGMPSVRDACAPHSAPCPKDNETAAGLTWPKPLYIEVYHRCLGRLQLLP